MRPLTLAMILGLVAERSAAQASAPVTHHQLTDHIALDLPRAWTATGSFAPGIQDSIDAIIRRAKDTLLAASQRNGPARTLLVAQEPGGALTLNLNVSPAPGVTLGTFGQFAPGDFVSHAQMLCRVMTDAMAAASASLDSCGPSVADSAGERTIIVLEYRRHGANGSFACWLVQYAIPDAIVSLTLVAREADAARGKGTFTQIWRAVAVQ